MIIVFKAAWYLDEYLVLAVLPAVLYIGLCVVFRFTRKYIYEHW